ncbi:MAG: type VI secretion system baseplate subunit TssG [Planctomycetota bacterium]|nr:type VI secretion system baseplate subunit TssG [Planctomycetota bacterium]
MGAAARPTPDDLIAQIADPRGGWDFFHAVRAIQRAHEDHPPIGTSGLVGDDPVRLNQKPSLAFPATSFAGLGPPAGGPNDAGARRVFLHCFGVLAPAGPFPTHLTRFIRSREVSGNDPAAARFIDLFHHRMACLFYRAWQVCNIAASQDRPSSSRFSDHIGALCGYGTTALRHRVDDSGVRGRSRSAAATTPRDAVDPDSKLHFAAHLASPTRHPEGLRAILSACLGTTVTVREFLGRWISVPDASRTRLGSAGAGVLGSTALAGSHVFDCQSAFRLVLGPMPLPLYRQLLPGAPGHDYVRDWIRTYLGNQLDVQIQLVVAADNVPMTRLGGEGGGAQLGMTSWLLSSESRDDRGDLTVMHQV